MNNRPHPVEPATELMQGLEIYQTARGGKLRLVQLPKPSPEPHELLIKVAYAGINRADILQREGKYPPPEGASPLPGLEVSGTITEIGEDVIGWSVGEEVCALLGGGGYAEYVTVDAGHVLPLPNRLTLKEGACLPEAAATATMALSFEANLQYGERVLIHGGTSGVGILMTQIAKHYGAEVFATVGSAEKLAFLKEFDVHAIDHRVRPFGEQVMQLTHNEGVDVIIDILGASQLATHFSLLRRGGRMVSLAMMDGNTVESLKISRMLTHHLRWSGATLRSRTAEEKSLIMDRVRTYIWPHLTTGRIKPVVDSCFPLLDAEKAQERMQERLHLGKILLEVASK